MASKASQVCQGASLERAPKRPGIEGDEGTIQDGIVGRQAVGGVTPVDAIYAATITPSTIPTSSVTISTSSACTRSVAVLACVDLQHLDEACGLARGDLVHDRFGRHFEFANHAF